MRTTVRLWRTETEGELVLDGDRKAAFLAYGENDEVEVRDQAAAAKLQPKGSKSADAPENKSEDPPVNKSEQPADDKAPVSPPKPKRQPRARKTTAPKK